MLEVTGIYKKFRNRQILKGVSFQAEPGMCVGIAGGNGCGKTTLLSILAGVSRPDAGSIRFDGKEAVGKRKIFEKKAAYVPQSCRPGTILPSGTRGTKREWRRT